MTHDSLDRAYARGERFFDEELFAESLNVPEADRAEVSERQTQLLHERDTWRNHVANSDERMHERIDAALASGPIAFQAQLTSEANRLPEDQRDAFMLHQMRLAHPRKWRTVPPSSEVDDRDIPIREPPAGLAPPPGIQRDDGPLMASLTLPSGSAAPVSAVVSLQPPNPGRVFTSANDFLPSRNTVEDFFARNNFQIAVPVELLGDTPVLPSTEQSSSSTAPAFTYTWRSQPGPDVPGVRIAVATSVGDDASQRTPALRNPPRSSEPFHVQSSDEYHSDDSMPSQRDGETNEDFLARLNPAHRARYQRWIDEANDSDDPPEGYDAD